jgi:hypothetical protein
MKKLRFSFLFAFVLLSAAIGVKAQTQFTDFTGNWMLDKEKTNTSKDFPQKLKNYKMAVRANETLISVKSQVEGTVEVQAAGLGTRTPVTESSKRTDNSATMGDSTSVRSEQFVNYGGTMALFFTVNEVTYKPDGKEEKIETPQGLVRLKAKPDKGGKVMQFTIIRRMKMKTGEAEVITREEWKLSEDGKSMRLHRTVQTPDVRDEIIMFLSKVV